MEEAATAHAAAGAQELVSDDMLLDTYTLANTRLRQVLQAAGVILAPSLQQLQELQLSIQQQQTTGQQSSLQEDELVALLAEENYQLRQLVHQVQLQQQAQHVQRQLEAALLGDALELDRFSDTGTPAAAAAAGFSSVFQAGISTAEDLSDVAAPAELAATAVAASPLHGRASLTPGSPAVVTAGILVPPSASAVQLAEAEAAAQLMTQALIQAEAALVYDTGAWQQDCVGIAQQHAQQQMSASASQEIQQQPHAEDTKVCYHRIQVEPGSLPLTSAAAKALAADSTSDCASPGSPTHSKPAAALGNSNYSFGLLGLPKLLLPSRALKRSSSKHAGSSGDTEISHASSIPGEHDIQVVTTARRIGLTATDPGGWAAFGSSSGLKDIANNLLLMPLAVSTGQCLVGAAAGNADAAAAAADDDDDLFDPQGSCLQLWAPAAAAQVSASTAAAQVWAPAALAVLKGSYVSPTAAGGSAGGSSAAVIGNIISRSGGRPASPCSRAAAMAAAAVQGVRYPGSAAVVAADCPAAGFMSPVMPESQLQQQPVSGSSNLQYMHGGVSRSTALPPLQPGFTAPAGSHTNQLRHPAVPGTEAAAHAAAAAAAFADYAQQEQEQQQQQPLVTLPKLRLHARAPTDVGAAAGAVVAASAAIAGSSSSSSPCSDSAFFRAAAAADRADSASNLEYSAFAAGGLQRRHRGSEVFSSTGRISSDFFGARISMDGSLGLPPRVSFTGGNSSRDYLSDLGGSYGVPDTSGDACESVNCRDTLTPNLNSSEWLGVSYQQSWQQQTEDVLQQAETLLDPVQPSHTSSVVTAAAGVDANSSNDQQWPTLPKLQLPSRRQEQQQPSISSSGGSRDQQQQQGSNLTNPSSSLVPAPDIPDNYFYQDYISSCASDSFSSLQGAHSSALPGTRALSRGTAAEADGSLSRPESEVTVSGMVSFSQHLSGAAGASSSQQQQQQSHLSLSDLSLPDVNDAARTQQPTPVLGQESLVATCYQDLTDATRNVARTRANNAVQHQQLTLLPQAVLDPRPGELEGGISSDQLRQLLADLAVAQEQQQQQIMSAATLKADDAVSAGTPSTAWSCGPLTVHTSGALSLPTAADRLGLPCSSAAEAAALQQQHSGGIPPRSPSRDRHWQQRQLQQDDRDLSVTAAGAAGPLLQRTLSMGSMTAQLPPKFGVRGASSGSLSSMNSQQLQQQQQQHECSSLQPVISHSCEQEQQQQQQQRQQQPAQMCLDSSARGAAAREVSSSRSPAAAAAAAVPVRPGTAGGIHSRLRVITAVKGMQSTGSNSDADTTSTTTTPVHPHGTHTRNNSSSSLTFRAGSGLASITVPPSPASSGVRYVPASPRVVGFDCPSTPQSALRSPSCRSDHSIADSAAGLSTAGAGMTGMPGMMGHASHLSFTGAGGVCNSGCSTPRRQPTSPGLLHQALARTTHISGCGSGSSTPSATRRAASTSCVPSPAHAGFISACHHVGVPLAPLGAGVPSAFAAHASCNSSSNGQNSSQGGAASLLTTGPLGTPSPKAAGDAVGGVHGRARSCSSTLLNVMTGGQLQQQLTVLQHISYQHQYHAQQPQPMPLQQQQQQQHGHGRLHADLSNLQPDSHTGSNAPQAAAAAACGSVVQGAGADVAASVVMEDGLPCTYTDTNSQRKQQQGVMACSSTEDHTAAAAGRAALLPSPPLTVTAAGLDRADRAVSPLPRPESPLARSVSPIMQGSSRSSSQSLAARATSPAKGAPEGHPVKLSRFGLMAAAEAHGPPSKQAAAAAVKPVVLRSLATTAPETAPEVKEEGACAAGAAATDVQTDLSNASSVASPDTPAVADASSTSAAALGSDCSRDATPTAAAAELSMPAGPDTFHMYHCSTAAGLQAVVTDPAAAVDPAATSADSIALTEAAALTTSAEDGCGAVPTCAPAGLGTGPLEPQHQQHSAPGLAQSMEPEPQVSSSSTAQSTSSTAGAAIAAASALMSRLVRAQHHEVLVASGRRTSQALPYVPAYMSSNAANALRQISANSRSAGSNTSLEPVPPSASTVLASRGSQQTLSAVSTTCGVDSNDVAGPAAACVPHCCPSPAATDGASCSWDVQPVMEPMQQRLTHATVCTAASGHDQQRWELVAHRDTRCVAPGFVKRRVRSWSQSVREGPAATVTTTDTASFRTTALDSPAETAATSSLVAVEDGSSLDGFSSKRMRAGGTAAAAARQSAPAAMHKQPAAGASRPTKRRQHAKSKAPGAAAAAVDTSASTTRTPCFMVDGPAASAAARAISVGGLVVFGGSAAVGSVPQSMCQHSRETAAPTTSIDPAVRACVQTAVDAVLQSPLQPQAAAAEQHEQKPCTSNVGGNRVPEAGTSNIRFHLSAQQQAQQFFAQSGAADERGALDRARAQQQQLLKQRQLLRQQQQQRRQEIMEWAEQQRLQQLAAQQQEVVDQRVGQDVDALQHSVPDQQRQQVDISTAEVTSYTADTVAADVAVDLPDGTVGMPVPFVHPAGFINFRALTCSVPGDEDGLSPTYADALAGEHVTSIGLVRAASYCPSLDSSSNLSWAAWSSSSSINRCPRLEWWGRSDQGTAGSGGFFSERGRQRQQQHGPSRLGAAGIQAAAAAGAGGGKKATRWFQQLMKHRGGTTLQQ